MGYNVVVFNGLSGHSHRNPGRPRSDILLVNRVSRQLVVKHLEGASLGRRIERNVVGRVAWVLLKGNVVPDPI